MERVGHSSSASDTLAPAKRRKTGRLAVLLPHYRKNRFAFIMGFLLLVLTSLTAVSIPYLLKMGIDQLSEATRNGLIEMWWIVFAIIVLALLHAGFRIGSRYWIFSIGRRVEYDLRGRVLQTVQSLDQGYLDGTKIGDLTARGSRDVIALRMFMGAGFLQVSNALLIYAAVVPMMLSLDPVLAVAALSPLPLVLLGARLLTRRLYRYSRVVADRFGTVSGFVQESLAGIETLRNHARESHWQKRFDATADDLFKAHLDHARIQGAFAPLMVLAGGLGALVILFLGSERIVAGTMTIGDYVAFNGYLALLVMPTIGFGWILSVLQRGLAALDRLVELFDAPVDPGLAGVLETSERSSRINTINRPRSSEWSPPEIQVRRLTFSYNSPGHSVASAEKADNSEPAIEEITLTLNPGSFVGLVGPVGSGKSTLLNVLARVRRPPDATVFLDGRDINDCSESELRALLSMAPQESHLFSASIRENLLYGVDNVLNQSAESDRLKQRDDLAWKMAHLSDFDEEIRSFPDGLDTLVGERGITLSGGQRQRATYARALAVDPAILLLDDIFSHVDAKTEFRMLERLLGTVIGSDHTVAKRTLVLVSHRIETLKRADSILVMDKGHIVATGRYDDLLEKSPLFQSLHTAMQRKTAMESLEKTVLPRIES
ncbi:MAG: ABC transporter ATP-binding protein [Magnetococcales bacterium]|nr:ABC transporter ATP-binding protein [Magnetococcales bacterium]